MSVANVGVYNFSTVAFFFWEKIAFEISVCNIHLVILSGHWLPIFNWWQPYVKGLVAPQRAIVNSEFIYYSRQLYFVTSCYFLRMEGATY